MVHPPTGLLSRSRREALCRGRGEAGTSGDGFDCRSHSRTRNRRCSDRPERLLLLPLHAENKRGRSRTCVSIGDSAGASSITKRQGLPISGGLEPALLMRVLVLRSSRGEAGDPEALLPSKDFSSSSDSLIFVFISSSCGLRRFSASSAALRSSL